MRHRSISRGWLPFVVLSITGALLAPPPRAIGADAPDLKALAAAATGQDSASAKAAIAQLRAVGPAGLAALIDANSALVQQHRAGLASAGAADGSWARLSGAIDAVAAQKDAWSSGLYWYTDLAAAERAAKASGKPILSLRMLGTLDTEFSCANSRFFRTVLYANAEVSDALSRRFVLHWKSVRPVPKVTIDFGDGRIVERTITGNSIHYVLDADGRVIDGIPGLYGPKAFLRLLDEAAAHADAAGSPKDSASLAQWHAVRTAQIAQAWQEDLQKVGAAPRLAVATGVQPLANGARPPQMVLANPPPALAAGRLAVSKFGVEGIWVAAIAPDPKSLEALSTDETWSKIAALHDQDAKLDAGSRALMAAKNPDAMLAGRLAISKSFVESPLVKIVRNFERSIAEDAVRNEYTFHRQIHAWLAAGKLPDGASADDVIALNERVYADLFLTPSADPWLGLLLPNTYSALPNDGLCVKR